MRIYRVLHFRLLAGTPRPFYNGHVLGLTGRRGPLWRTFSPRSRSLRTFGAGTFLALDVRPLARYKIGLQPGSL